VEDKYMQISVDERINHVDDNRREQTNVEMDGLADLDCNGQDPVAACCA
jgi:hypothetical protein